MNDTRALCPNCKNVVQFERAGDYNRCPDCGAMYRLAQWQSPAEVQKRERRQEGTAIGEILGLFAKAILIMVAVALVGLAVAFAGCALAVGGHL